MVGSTHVRHFVSVAVLVAAIVSPSWARTPTPTITMTYTFGPSPTITLTGTETPEPTRTPTGTPPPPLVTVTVAPDPARSGQTVMLDASATLLASSFAWAQIDGPAVVLTDSDRAVASFVVPSIDDASSATFAVTATGRGASTVDVTIPLLPADMVQLEIGTVVGATGQRVPLDVVLRPAGLAITHVEHAFEPAANGPIPELPSGAPECEPGPGVAVESSEFAFEPDGCETSDTCTGVRAMVTASAPIPDGAVVYRCNVLVADSNDTDCREPITCGAGLARAQDTAPTSSLRVSCRDGEVGTDFSLAEPVWGAVIAEPARPLVGDQVRVSFLDPPQLPFRQLSLLGTAPILSGDDVPEEDTRERVSFDLQAECPGTASLSLRILWETPAGCSGFQFSYFTTTTSPIFRITVRDPGTPCPGDCDGDNHVAVNELITAVTIALELADIEACDVVDQEADGLVQVDDIVRAVHAALDGCPVE